jgi:hypothetical protein
MPKTVPGRRIVVAEEVLEETTEAIKEALWKEAAPVPTTHVVPGLRKLTYKERLQRRLEMADLALEKYEKRLCEGKHLEPEEERLFLAHQDSIRKLEATLMALEQKDLGKEHKTDAEYVVDLVDSGWALEDACRMFKHNTKILAEAEEALRERE